LSKQIKQTKNPQPIKENTVKNRSVLLPWLCSIGIALITFIVFLPSLNDYFTNWDDTAYVVSDKLVTNGNIDFAKIFTTPVSSNYHPLTILSLAINYQIGDLKPFSYHFVNIILHVLNTVLVFLFIFLLTRRNLLMACIVALLFGIHPMHVESVTWVSERKDVLYVFFFLSGLITYLKYTKTKKTTWYILTFLLFTLSCLSKGMAVTFPVILLLIDYYKNTPLTKIKITEKIPFFILSVVIGIIAIRVQSPIIHMAIIQSGKTISATQVYSPLQHILFASYGVIMYMVKLVIPYKLSAFYTYPPPNTKYLPIIFYLSPVILICLLAALCCCFIKKEKAIVFGFLFYLTSIVLVLQFISVGQAIMADRYSYLSYIGLFFILALVIDKLWQTNNILLKYGCIIIVITSSIIFSYQTHARTQVWQNSESLCTNVIDNYPDATIAYSLRGLYYANNNNIPGALLDYKKTLHLDSVYGSALINYSAVYYNRSLIYSNEGKTDSALSDLTTAINYDTNYAAAYTNRGILYCNKGLTALALHDFTKAISLDSTISNAYSDRALIYYENGRNDLALADLSKAIANNPSFAPNYYHRGICYKANKQYKNAIDDFNMAIRLDPQNSPPYNNSIAACIDSINNHK
jgi:tetratricopeptide (TPR) repeat protein